MNAKHAKLWKYLHSTLTTSQISHALRNSDLGWKDWMEFTDEMQRLEAHWKEVWAKRVKQTRYDSLSQAEKWIAKHQPEFSEPLKVDYHPTDGYVVYTDWEEDEPPKIRHEEVQTDGSIDTEEDSQETGKGL